MIRIVAVAVFLTLATFVVWLVTVIDRPVVKVRVVGELNAAEQLQVRETLNLNINGGLLKVDLQQIAASLEELSWPRNVKVRRVWPDSLTVELDKAMVVAAWNDDYLTMDGQVVQLAMEVTDLVRFDCLHTQPLAALDLYQRLQREASGAGLQIARLSENELGEWSLELTNGIELNIGVSELSERVQRFIAVYQAELADRIDEVASVDARYASGIAVSWHSQNDLNGSISEDLAVSFAGNNTRVRHGFR